RKGGDRETCGRASEREETSCESGDTSVDGGSCTV
ncbi:hypothetical protein D020_4475B, partial [Vibrio parahaemolyticus SBR10290]